MRYFHCSKTYRGKAYGCGATGPVNATIAFLDMGMTCRVCWKKLKPVRKVKLLAKTSETCKARGPMGYMYCEDRTVSGDYCKRHTASMNAVEVAG